MHINLRQAANSDPLIWVIFPFAGPVLGSKGEPDLIPLRSLGFNFIIGNRV